MTALITTKQVGEIKMVLWHVGNYAYEMEFLDKGEKFATEHLNDVEYYEAMEIFNRYH